MYQTARLDDDKDPILKTLSPIQNGAVNACWAGSASRFTNSSNDIPARPDSGGTASGLTLDKSSLEKQLLGVLLKFPDACRAVHRQFDPLQNAFLDDVAAQKIFGAIGELVAAKREISEIAIEAMMQEWAKDPLTKHPESVLLAADRISAFRANCPSLANENNAIEMACRLAQEIKARHFASLPPLQSEEPQPLTLTTPLFTVSPRPLAASLRPVPVLAPKMLPASLRPWLHDIAERFACPLEFVAVPALITLASVVGRKVGIRPKRFDNWQVTPNLWGAIVGEPSTLKTPAAEEALRPLKKLADTAREIYEEELLDFKAKKKESPKDELEEPIQRRYIINDATVPALGQRLAENPNGLLLNRDELLGWLKALEKEQAQGDRPFYLQAWNGTEENYTYDRVGRGTLVIPHVCLSIFGTIQPGPLREYVKDAQGGAQADGLMQRLQLLVFPDPVMWRNIDRSPDIDAEDRAFEVFERMHSFESVSVGAEYEEGRTVPFLRFSPPAQDLFNEWRTELEIEKLQNSKDSPAILSHLAKYRSLMPTLALLFHLAQWMEDCEGNAVSLVATEMAAAWCDFLEDHMRRVYMTTEEVNHRSAQTIADRLGDLNDPFTAYDISRKGWRGLKTNEDILCALTVMEQRHWIKSVEDHAPAGSKGGRPTLKYFINPHAREAGEAS